LTIYFQLIHRVTHKKRGQSWTIIFHSKRRKKHNSYEVFIYLVPNARGRTRR